MKATKDDTPRTALIFGGSRGIGAAIARGLAAEGFAIALTYVSRPDQAKSVVAAIETAGGRAIAIEADSANASAIERAVAATLSHFGSLHVAVINAGVYRTAPIGSITVEDLDLMLDVNVRGVVLAIQAAATRMHDGGRIITIGSIAADSTGVAGSSIYAMTKAAVAKLVRGAALELAPRGITVNNIQPGPIDTDMAAAAIPQLIQKMPLGRVGQTADIAALAAYLASEASGYMTGSSISIDGGFAL